MKIRTQVFAFVSPALRGVGWRSAFGWVWDVGLAFADAPDLRPYREWIFGAL
jgi:hypothetical protein